MAAVVTDQFRILNANNFVDSVLDDNNSYYVFLGLPNSSVTGFGRTSDWNTSSSGPPSPTDNLQYLSHYKDTGLFGKRVTSANIRRVIRKVQWTTNTAYDMYRHDYSVSNPTPNSQTSRLYDSNYYVINSDYKVYICIDNGSSGTNITGSRSKFEPTSTDLQPFSAGSDGYLWKYLFSISPSDVIKFDSTEYIVVPNDWATTSDSQIQSVREAGDSDTNNNQIKKVYIKSGGTGYSNGTYDILGDGSGAKVSVTVDSNGTITSTNITSGGSGYTFGIVDLKRTGTISSAANLIPIIPPSKGHGYDLYTELGTDKVLVYARFDDSTKDFPIDTSFAQIGIIKNPTSIGSDQIYTDNTFSGLYSLKFSSITGTPQVGEKIQQTVANSTGKAYGYVASWDTETKVLKYFQDRSLYYNQTTFDQQDYIGISTNGRVYPFESSASLVTGQSSAFSGSIDTGFSGITTNPTGTKLVNLSVNFTSGMASPEINKGSGELIYLDNRPIISRNSRQKEDIKVILEF